jgi:hypothetical protein
MQTSIVTRLLDGHPDSLPLLMLRGHALVLSSKFASALRHYFLVRPTREQRTAALASEPVLQRHAHSCHLPPHATAAIRAS